MGFASANGAGGKSIASPLLQDPIIVKPAREKGKDLAHVGSVGVIGCVSNLVLAVLGAGQLVLPYAMGELGLIFGVLALVLFTLLSIHSLKTLTLYETHQTPSCHCCIESYSELVVRTVGPAGSGACKAILAVYAWGGALSFMVILKEQLASLSGQPQNLCIAVLAAVIYPLSSLQDVSPLKRFSPLGCVSAVFITFVVLFSVPWSSSGSALGAEACEGPSGASLVGKHGNSELGELRLWPKSFTAMAAALPLLSFALNSSWAYVPILCSLSERSAPLLGAPRASALIWTSNGIIFANYILLSIYGYVMFCDHTRPNVLDSFRDGGFIQMDGSDKARLVGLLVRTAQVALSVQLAFALPMRFFVARRSMVGQDQGRIPRLALSAALVGSAAVLAILPLELQTVMGVTSSICASMIIYILPSAVDLFWRLPAKHSSLRLAASMLSMAVGLFVLCGGLVANLAGVAVGS